ncbi:MAG: hypothetical protein JW726_11420 [Anaerolineales bacterium]|nr:hypothetical protein [Anaerolineales bacterium]
MHNLAEIRSRVSLVALAEEAGAVFEGKNRLSSHCPLPQHRGDRSSKAFTIYDQGRKWKCHSSCPENANGGDLFAFYMAWKGVDFTTAVQELAARARICVSSPPTSQRVILTRPAPVLQPPCQAWRDRADDFVIGAQQCLLGEQGAGARAYLEKERGLWLETWQAFRLGYNPQNIYDDPGRWGLEGKKIWLPRGIVIPGLDAQGRFSYIKIRRPQPDDVLGRYVGKWVEQDGAPKVKFGGPRGGQAVLFGLQVQQTSPVLVLVEGEWDAMLVWQWCRDLCNVSTLGGAGAHADLLDLVALVRYAAVIVVHDDDSAGDQARAYWTRLRHMAPRIRVTAPPAHDLTDFWRAGQDLRSWVAREVAEALGEALRQVHAEAHPEAIGHWRRLMSWARQEAGAL